MRPFVLAIFVLCCACESKSTIENRDSKDVKKDSFDWKDPGAKPDAPLDAGASMDASMLDAAVLEPDAG